MSAVLTPFRRWLGGSDDAVTSAGDGTAGTGTSAEADTAVAAQSRSETKRPSSVRWTGRWQGIAAVALLAVAVGVLAKRPSLLLVGALAGAYAAYPRLTATPEPDLSIRREIEPIPPEDGDLVTVRTTITNEGDATLADIRIVDGTPPMLSVSAGSPRCGTALPPGGAVTVQYELRARPGRHVFQPTTVLCRDASGAVEVEDSLTAASSVECAAEIPTVPLRTQTGHHAGPLVTDDGGEGLEFHFVTEYQRGDPANRIDWRRYARTGELTSLAFRVERLAKVMVCVDARPASYRAGSATDPHAVALGIDAADRIGDALFDANHRVGLAGFGRDVCVLPARSGRDHANRFHDRLATDPAFRLQPPASARVDRDTAPTTQRKADNTTTGAVSTDDMIGVASTDGVTDNGVTSDGGEGVDTHLSRIRTRLGSNTQVVLITPLCDDEASRIAQRFESEGTAVTVVSPNVTAGRTAGGRLAEIERAHRLSALRSAGIPVVDWSPDQPLGAAMASIERGCR